MLFGKDKKGFSFMMDVALGLIITFLILTLANFYVTRVGVDAYPELQIGRTGSDMINLLDYFDYLNPPSDSQIQQELNRILPAYYDMKINGIGESGCDFEVGNDPPNDRLIISGERFFVIKGTDDYEYCIARYRVWQK